MAVLHRIAALRGAMRGRFQRDVLWNFGSLAVLGVSGIALNVLIGKLYGAATLGVFNQVLAAYIFFSQAAVGGIDRSVLRATAGVSDDRPAVSEIIVAAMLPTVALAAAWTALFWFAREPLAAWLESPGVAKGIAAATPGLFFFAVNKVLLGAVNGLRRMRSFAVFQALRYVLILGGLLVAIARDMDGDRLAFVFSFAETLLFVGLAVEVALQVARPAGRAWLAWSREHLVYGMKSVVSGMLLELNARVDVLMLGYFLDDDRVGIYSFAAILAEGVFQLVVVLQNNYNPLLAQHVSAGRMDELVEMVRKGRRAAYLLMLAVGVVAIAGYPVYVLTVAEKPEFWQSWLPFGILVTGIFLCSGYYPFSQLLLMANRPASHTVLMVSIVGSNVLFNWLLIPRFDIAGAALGTATSFVATVFLLRFAVSWRVGVRI